MHEPDGLKKLSALSSVGGIYVSLHMAFFSVAVLRCGGADFVMPVNPEDPQKSGLDDTIRLDGARFGL